jgi:hypothetical protein
MINNEDIKVGDYITVIGIKDRPTDGSFRGDIFQVLAKDAGYLSCDRIYPVGLAKIFDLGRYEFEGLSIEFVQSIENARLQQLKVQLTDYLQVLIANGKLFKD